MAGISARTISTIRRVLRGAARRIRSLRSDLTAVEDQARDEVLLLRARTTGLESRTTDLEARVDALEALHAGPP